MAYQRSGKGGSLIRQVATFIGVSTLAGVVLAGIALPAVGALGLSAKGAIADFNALPSDLKQPPLSQATHILDANGDLIATVYSRDRTVVPLDKISPVMQKAIVAIEDSRYWQHGAVDPRGILRALHTNAQDGGVAQGASTLAQQYVKNLKIEEAGDDPKAVAEATQQTLGRKIRELKYAIELEKELGKRKILENYLNITFFGEQAYGIQAAAQRYFSTDAKDLNLPQAALLAGIVQSPTRYDPLINPGLATERRDTVLARMAQLGDITRAQAKAAEATPLGLHTRTPRNGCITATDGAGFFCDYVRRVILADPAFGSTEEQRSARWAQGGLTIRTTLEPQAESAVEASLHKHVYASDPVAAAATLIQPGTGRIVAMGESRPYGLGQDDTQLNYNISGFQSGSTFKPITAAAAIEGGADANTVLPAPYQMAYPSPVSTCGNPWVNTDNSSLTNQSKSEVGPMNMQKAMALSVNTYFVQLIGQIGICPVVQMAEKMGVRQADGSPLQQVPSITLGTMDVSPLTMASAYATFANGGVYCTPVAIESITDASGRKLPAPKTSCSRAMSQSTAATINTLLKGVVEDGTGTQAGLSGRDTAGKTGTTDSLVDAWFVGYTSNMAGAVWVGDPKQERKMYNITIGGVFHKQVFGADTPGPIWRDAMNGALASTSSASLPTVSLGGSGNAPGTSGNAGLAQSPDPSPAGGNNPFSYGLFGGNGWQGNGAGNGRGHGRGAG